MTNVKELQNFKDYGKVVSISNGIIEAYVTIDIGPRIIRFGYVGEQNILHSTHSDFSPRGGEEYENHFGKGRYWDNFGGHRVWIAPESFPETYSPDDKPVKYEITPDGAIFTPPAETENSVQKQIEVKMSGDSANMQVIMRVTNIGKETKKFAIWGLSVSEKNGTLIIPMNDNDTGLLSNRIISVWPYTDMMDERIYWGKKYITVRQNPNNECHAKIGTDLNCGTVYFVLGNDVFRKKFKTLHPNAEYPDGGCSFETYTDDAIIENETLGELKNVAPGETSEHSESWSLFKKPCDVDFKDDASIENLISKL